MSTNISLPRMPWYPSDFAGATRDWPLIARGVYRELLDAQWDMGSIPADETTLCMMIRASRKEWKEAWPRVGAKFVLCEDGRLRNLRLEMHRDKAIALSESRRRNAQGRWGKPDGTESDAIAYPNASASVASLHSVPPPPPPPPITCRSRAPRSALEVRNADG